MKKPFTYLLLFIFAFISTFTPYSASANMFPPPTFNNIIQQQQQMNDQMQRQQQDLNNQMSQQQQDLERSIREMEEQKRELMRQQQEEMLRNMSFQEQMNEFARQMQENTIKATFTIGTTVIILTFPDPKEELIDLGKDILWDLFWEFVTEGILGVIFDGDRETHVESDQPYTDKPEESSEEEPIECNCFIAGTLVSIDKGSKPIEYIQMGDKVLAKDDKTGDIQFKNVNFLFKKETEITYTIKVGKEKIITTPDHPFWIKDRGWVEAEHLRNNDLLITSSGQWLPIKDIVIEQQKIIVYNFEVDDYHSYFVSNLGIWVHNDCSIFAKGALNHILNGELNSGKKPVGFHYESIMDNGEITKILKPENNLGVYKAKVKIHGKEKEAPSTFYPKKWNKGKIVETINEAYNNRTRIGEYKYKGNTSSGVTIVMYLDKNNKIKTAYPLY